MAAVGLPAKALFGNHGVSNAGYCRWEARLGGISVSGAQRLKALEADSEKLKRLLAHLLAEVDALGDELR